MQYPARFFSLCALFFALLGPAGPALAVPPPVAPLAERVTDFSGLLSVDALSYLSSVIEEDEKPGGPRVRVVLINDPAPEAIDSYAERLLAAQPELAGVEALMVVEPAAKTARIAVRAAARPRLSPIAARIILRENVFLFLQERGVDGGIFSAIEHGSRSMAEALRGVPVEGATLPGAAKSGSSSAAVGDGLVGIPPYATVSDQTGTLAAADIAGLSAEIESLKARKGAQVAILMLASTMPETIEQFSLRAFEAWKPGRKGVDDGVLVVVAKDDRRLRIEVGYGLEAVIPDAIASRIIYEQMTPRFKQGDFGGGLLSGLERISHLIDGEQLAPVVESSYDMPSPEDLEIAAVIVALALIARYWLHWYLSVLIAIAGTGGLLWFFNGAGTATLLLACLAGAITFILPAVILGVGRSSSGSGRWDRDSDRSSSGSSRSSSSSSDGDGGSSGGGGASGSW